jgi:hypothetical protein
MTLLTEIILVLQAADVKSYMVHSSVRDLPGDPDLVVKLTPSADQQAADLLAAAPLQLTSIKRVRPGVIHLWALETMPGCALR